jgi:hypothetical protein
MSTSFSALCNDFYVNQKLALKMDLPSDRETILHLFDQVKKTVPTMTRFRRYQGELALESSRRELEYRWLALRRTSIRTGHVNPRNMAEAYKLHRLILEHAPYHLTISPLDVDYVELLFGFDLECRANHDAIVYEALFAGSPMSELLGSPESGILDVQPVFGLSMAEGGDMQAYFEVRTRTKTRRGRSSSRSKDEPISIFLTVRKYGPVTEIAELQDNFATLVQHAETLATERVIPCLLQPIARRIAAGSG